MYSWYPAQFVCVCRGGGEGRGEREGCLQKSAKDTFFGTSEKKTPLLPLPFTFTVNSQTTTWFPGAGENEKWAARRPVKKKTWFSCRGSNWHPRHKGLNSGCLDCLFWMTVPVPCGPHGEEGNWSVYVLPCTSTACHTGHSHKSLEISVETVALCLIRQGQVPVSMA